jgi:hypothetical protein
MSSIYLQLTAAGRFFSLSPLPAHLYALCTDERCGARASHRLLSRRTALVSLFCDAHTEEWARAHGVLPAVPSSASLEAIAVPQSPMKG